MIEIRGRNANDLFVKIANNILEHGVESSPRGLKTLDLVDAWLVLEDPSKSFVTLPERDASKEYFVEEMKWYLTGSYDVEGIRHASSFWGTLADSNGEVNSNYGQIALRDKFNGKTQFDWCFDRLSHDLDSRQAVINYNQPRHKMDGVKDFPCTLTQSFRVNDGKLDSNVVMRSNDFIYGLTYDMPWFTYVQKKLAQKLNLDVGVYNHLSNSLHVYEKHFEMLNNIAKSTRGS